MNQYCPLPGQYNYHTKYLKYACPSITSSMYENSFKGMNKARLKPTQHNPGGHNDIIHYIKAFICNTGEPNHPNPSKERDFKKESDIEVMLLIYYDQSI